MLASAQSPKCTLKTEESIRSYQLITIALEVKRAANGDAEFLLGLDWLRKERSKMMIRANNAEDERFEVALNLAAISLILFINQLQKIDREDLSDEWRELYDQFGNFM